MQHEIMTIEEVAQFLRVSERTVYDWAQKGEIPGGKLGTAWRFKRSEIEEWVDQRLEKAPVERATSDSAEMISSVLAPERVVFLTETTKKEVLRKLIDVLAETPYIKKRNVFEKEIFNREELMSTGIGFGVAVPHVRIASVTDLVMAVGICREPVTDYESLDGEPVNIVCMVAARKDQHTRYIRTLSAISSRLKDEEMRQRILKAELPEEAFRLICGEG